MQVFILFSLSVLLVAVVNLGSGIVSFKNKYVKSSSTLKHLLISRAKHINTYHDAFENIESAIVVINDFSLEDFFSFEKLVAEASLELSHLLQNDNLLTAEQIQWVAEYQSIETQYASLRSVVVGYSNKYKKLMDNDVLKWLVGGYLQKSSSKQVVEF